MALAAAAPLNAHMSCSSCLATPRKINGGGHVSCLRGLGLRGVDRHHKARQGQLDLIQIHENPKPRFHRYAFTHASELSLIPEVSRRECTDEPAVPFHY